MRLWCIKETMEQGEGVTASQTSAVQETMGQMTVGIRGIVLLYSTRDRKHRTREDGQER
jgi:hypothetical protein